MAGFFSVRVAPGVRLSASPRGLRAHVGPRGARLHVGGGGTGVSTGAGPVTFYQSVGRRRRPAQRGFYGGPTRSEIAKAEKQQQALRITEALRAIDAIHREAFPEATKPAASPPALTPYAVLLRHFEREELKDLGFFKFAERKAAKARAREQADRQARVEVEKAKVLLADAQRKIDERWDALLRNDPDVVLDALSAAFEDNGAPTAAVGVEDGTVFLTVLIPPAVEVIPERYPATTAAGNLSLAKMPKKMVAAWFRELVAAHLLVAVKETFAIAPGLQSASIVAMRHSPDGGDKRLEPLLAAVIPRAALDKVDWQVDRAWEALNATCSPLYRLRGSAANLVPIELSDQPDLEHLTSIIDFEEETAD